MALGRGLSVPIQGHVRVSRHAVTFKKTVRQIALRVFVAQGSSLLEPVDGNAHVAFETVTTLFVEHPEVIHRNPVAFLGSLQIPLRCFCKVNFKSTNTLIVKVSKAELSILVAALGAETGPVYGPHLVLLHHTRLAQEVHLCEHGLRSRQAQFCCITDLALRQQSFGILHSDLVVLGLPLRTHAGVGQLFRGQDSLDRLADGVNRLELL
mmetsp:Transcript_24168/g.70928  ORF Transcript_24168/g.70928 Transcript_24168/m.70928 type:complete len:209 (-) Transcript_24168:568-1194(-)